MEDDNLWADVEYWKGLAIHHQTRCEELELSLMIAEAKLARLQPTEEGQ